MNYMKYNTATEIIIGPLVGEDGKTPYTGTVLASEVKLSKGSDSSGTITYGAFASATNAPAHMANGLYKLSITATEAQCGILAVSTVKATAWLSHWEKFEVLTNMGYGIMRGSLVVPSNVLEIEGIAVATNVDGYFPSDIRRVDGSALSSHTTGNFPADVREIVGITVASASSGFFPADVQKVDSVSLATHTAGKFPADATISGTVSANVIQVEGSDASEYYTSVKDATISALWTHIENQTTSINSNTDTEIDGAEANIIARINAGVTTSDPVIILPVDVQAKTGLGLPSEKIYVYFHILDAVTGLPVYGYTGDSVWTVFRDGAEIGAIGGTIPVTYVNFEGLYCVALPYQTDGTTLVSALPEVSGYKKTVLKVRYVMQETNVYKVEGTDATDYFATLDDSVLAEVAKIVDKLPVGSISEETTSQEILDIVLDLAIRIPVEMSDITKDWVVDGTVTFADLMLYMIALIKGRYDLAGSTASFKRQDGATVAFENLLTETTRRPL